MFFEQGFFFITSNVCHLKRKDNPKSFNNKKLIIQYRFIFLKPIGNQMVIKTTSRFHGVQEKPQSQAIQ